MLDLTPRQAEVLQFLLDKYDKILSGDDEPELEDLTDREREIFILLASGKSYIQIAVRCDITHSTVKSHVSSILEKFGVTNTRAAVALGLKLRILTLDQISLKD